MLYKNIAIIPLVFLAIACAGPTTPLGSVNKLDPQKAQKNSLLSKDSPIQRIEKIIPARIDFEPKKQVLHDASQLRVRITDPLGITSTHKLFVFHNGIDVSESFASQSKKQILPDANSMEFTLNQLRLPAADDHEVEIYYYRSENETASASASLESPICHAFANQRVSNTGGFTVSHRLLSMIQRSASNAGFSPSLVTGLIAQESGFNNLSVSWAKAIGITQMTASAEEAIIKHYPHYPRYAGLNELSAPEIKALVILGRVNGGNEWRLDDEMSLIGGLAYLDSIKNFWYRPANFSILKNNLQNTEIGLAKVMLASYHSGHSRVKQSLQNYGKLWLDSEKELSEAKKYINKIFSFCYHFSEPKKARNDPTT